MRISQLRALTKLFVLVGGLAFLSIFVYGMFSPGPLSSQTIDFGGINTGSGQLQGWVGKPVWVVNRSEDQLNGLSSLTEFVSTEEEHHNASVLTQFRSLQPQYGVYLAETDQVGILVQYISHKPVTLPAHYPWYGGFVDPSSGALFDIVGRRYRNTEGDNLVIPPHQYIATELIELGRW